MKALVLAALVVAVVTASRAGALADTSLPLVPQATAAEQAVIDAALGGSSGAPAAKPDVALEPVRAAQIKVLEAYLKDQEVSFHQRRAGLEWNAFSSKVIFWMVIALVAFGGVLTAVQFRRGRTRETNETKVNFGASGIEVSSPVLGVIILAMSLAFFFLYLKYVYPVHELRATKTAATEAPPEKNAGAH